VWILNILEKEMLVAVVVVQESNEESAGLANGNFMLNFKGNKGALRIPLLSFQCEVSCRDL